jgi:3-oxoacyl-[acyl-carrier protein] reductase
MLELKGRGAIIVGAKRVGATVAERLAREGVRLAIVYRNSRIEAESLFGTVSRLVDRSCLIQADLTEEVSVRSLVNEAREQLGDLSFCINLAADYPRTSLDQLDGKAWERGMAAARAAFLLSLHASRSMAGNPGPTRGHIINFGDWAAAETPYVDFLPYLAGKATVHFLTRAFARELAPQGILVNGILPGPTAKPPDMPDAEWQEALFEAPLHRESSEQEMAELVTTLLRFETITGENIRVDSGRHIAGFVPLRTKS